MNTGNDSLENYLLDQFINQLKVERGLATNTILAYSSDLINFFDFLKRIRISPLQVTQVNYWLLWITKSPNCLPGLWPEPLLPSGCSTVFWYLKGKLPPILPG